MQARRLTSRGMLLALDALLHVGILAWFLNSRSAPEQVSAVESTLAMFDIGPQSPEKSVVSSADVQPKPPAPIEQAAVAPPIPVPAPLSVEQQVLAILGGSAASALAVPAQAEQATAAPGSDGCDLTVPIQTALRADPEIAALARDLPASTLTAAKAYMLWDANWIAPRKLADTSLDPIRQVIIEKVAAATIECRDKQQTGPRFVLVGPESAPVTLVIGSGSWRWSDLGTTLLNETSGYPKNTFQAVG